MSLAKGIKGKSRRRVIQAHRLLIYCEAINRYVDGKCDLEYVITRANKCLEAGLKVKV